MASPSYVNSLMGGLDAALKRSLTFIFEYVLNNLRLGRPDAESDRTRAENFQWYYHEATTPSTPDEEFSVSHGIGREPYALIPVLNLQVVGSKMVRLTVTRLPDSRRVYLSSPDADAAIGFYLEG